MEEGLADFAVDCASRLGASYVEARLEEGSSSGFVLKNGIPQVSGFDTMQGLGVRLIVNGSINFVSTNQPTKPLIKSLIERGIRLAKSSCKLMKSPIELSDEPAHEKKYEVKQKVKLGDVDVDTKLGFLEQLEKTATGSGHDVPARVFVVSDSLSDEYFTNSEGSRIQARVPSLSVVYVFTVKRGPQVRQRFLQFRGVGGWELLKGWDVPGQLSREIASLDLVMKEGKKPPKGVVDIVASGEITGIASHESVGHPYEADRILGREAAQAGESFMKKEMIGRRIAASGVNVVDDPTVPNSAGFYLYDSEGVKARRTFLIKDGIINDLLYNRETARTMGVRSNGHARALSFSDEALVRMSNTFVLPGDHSLDELVEDIKIGILMKSFMEWNIDDRRMHAKYVGNESYLIENGEVKGPVVNPVIETSTFNFWGSIDAVGKDLKMVAATCGKGEPMQGIPVLTGGPSIRLRKMRVRA